MGKIIRNAPFKYRMDLDAIDPFTPEEEELLRFLTEDPPADENALQRNYRLNRLKEFEERWLNYLDKSSHQKIIPQVVMSLR